MDNSESNNIEGWAITHTDRAIYQDIKERARACGKIPSQPKKPYGKDSGASKSKDSIFAVSIRLIVLSWISIVLRLG